MDIKFKKVSITNFLSIGHIELDLDNKGFVSIVGANNNLVDSAKSNGSGKSSLIESIVWNLTGETIRGAKDIVNKYTEGGCRVELTFTLDGNEYKLLRTKDDKELGTNLKIYVNGEDKSGKGIRDSEHILEEYLPDLTSSLIGSVIVLGQGLPQRFTNNTPSGRKEVLEKLSKSDYMIEDIKEKLSNRKTTLNNELRDYEDKVLSANSKKELLENRLNKLKSDKDALASTIDYDEEIKVLSTKLHDFIVERDKKEFDKDLNNTKLNEKLREYQDWTSKSNANYLSECVHIDEEFRIQEWNKKLSELQSDIKAQEQEIKRLENIKDTCPTCGQHLPDVHKVDLTPYRGKLKLTQEEYDYSNNNFKDISEKVKTKKEEILKKLNETTEEIKRDGTKLRETVNSLLAELETLNKDINATQLELDKIKLNKENNEKQKETIDNDIRQCELDLKSIFEDILYNNTRVDKTKEHIEAVSKMMTIATRDFRGYLLSEIISYIEKKAKEYSQFIFNHDKIDFKLEGNNINIYYCDKQYELLSGGEKQKIDIIIQFSIRDMLIQSLNFHSNLLVLDEVFDNLDTLGCQEIVNLILNKLNDIESVFVITHHTDIDVPYDEELIIAKNEKGISEIQ